MAISKKSWTGFDIETTPGTPLVNPTVFHPCKSKMTNKTKFVYVTEDRGGRDANTKRLGTVRMAQGEVSGSWYNDTGIYLLYGFMGHVVSTQPDATNAPTAYKHTLTLVDTPPAMTLWKGYDVAGYTFAYAGVEKLKLTFASDGHLLDYTSNITSMYGTKIAGALPTPTYSNEALFAGYLPTLKLSNVATTVIEEMEIEFSQKVATYYPINGGRDYTKLYYGDREAKVNFTASFDDDTMYQKFLQEQDDSLDIDFIGALIGTGPSTVHHELHFNFPIIGYDDMELLTDKEYIQVKAAATARPGTTVNSTFTADATNTVVGYTS